MVHRISPLVRARLQALLVTFLWSTSWVLIKFGLQDIPALTFAGLRYTLAFLCLLPVVGFSRKHRFTRGLSRHTWLELISLGLLFYSVTQGAQFLSLFYLPAVTTNLLLSFSTVVVAISGVYLLKEYPTLRQWSGVLFYMVGVYVYFYPIAIPIDQRIGLLIAILAVLANSFSSLLGRVVNRRQDLTPLQITVVSMGAGAITLLGVGVYLHGVPHLSLSNWIIVAWLAVVNTAFAFTLWNETLRLLSAMESSIMNSTMLIQIPILAWIFLDERLTSGDVVGLALAGLGILVVQLRWANSDRGSRTSVK